MTTPRESIQDEFARSEARVRDLEARLAALPPSPGAARTLAESMLASEQQLQQRLAAILHAPPGAARGGRSRRPVPWGGLAAIAALATAAWLLRSWRRR